MRQQIGIDADNHILKVSVYRAETDEVKDATPHRKQAIHHKFSINQLIKQEGEEVSELKKIMSTLSEDVQFMCTGYGFNVMAEEIRKVLSLVKPKGQITKVRRIQAIVNGMLHLMKQDTGNTFYKLPAKSVLNIHEIGMVEHEQPKKTYLSAKEIQFPLMIVNVSAGVSYYHVSENEPLRKLSGSIIGEETMISLTKLLTSYATIEDALHEFPTGDNRTIDMTVEDIYGGDYCKIGLPKDIIASSFGKAKESTQKLKHADKDVVKSLFVMMCMNIAQLACFNAELEKVGSIVFVSNKIDNVFINYLLTSFVGWWSKGKSTAIFLEDATNLGSLGALVTPH